MELPQLIKSIATTVFPLTHKHSLDTGDVVTFNITITDSDGNNGHVYRIHSFGEAMIQVRMSCNDSMAIVLGTRGSQKVEHSVTDLTELDDAVAFVCKLLQEDQGIGNNN